MKKFSLLLFTLSLCVLAFAQKRDPIARDWNAFYQKVDVTAFRGGEFKLTAYIKADTMSSESAAHMWARVDLENGKMGFFNNMYENPVKINKWKQYAIEGDIHKKAEWLLVGGLYFNKGRYFYDNFELKARSKDGEWQAVAMESPDCDRADVWQQVDNVRGFELTTTQDSYEGDRSLIVNGGKNFSYGQNEGEFVKVNDIKLYYETYGEGEPLLLLHGNAQSINAFSNQIPELSKHYQVIAVDTRGHGKSTEDGTKLSYELFAHDMITFMDKLNLEKVNLVGWSDGGNTGLIMAMNHPKRISKLAIMGAVLYNDKTSVDKKTNKMLKKELKRLEKETDKETFEQRMIRLLFDEPNLKPEELHAIQCSTLVMAGSEDIVLEDHTRLIAENIEKSELVLFENGTHFEPLENPGRFNNAVLQFLD